MYRPVVFAAGMFIAGLIFGLNGVSAVFYILISILYAYFLYAGKIKIRRFAFLCIFTCLSFLFAAAFGSIRGRQIHKTSQTEAVVSDSGLYIVTGTVRGTAFTDKGAEVKLLIESIGEAASPENTQETVGNTEYILFYCDEPTAEYGDRVQVLSEISIYENARNEGGFNAKNYYLARETAGYGYPERIDVIETDGKKLSVGKLLYWLKQKLISGIESVFSEKEAGVVTAMLSGDRTKLDEDLKEAYSETGFAHILAISGLHISIIGMGFFRLMRKAGRGYVFSSLWALLLLCLYDSFSGGQVSCKRAVIMLCFSLTARCLGQKYDRLTALAVAAVVILVRQPLYLYDSSFLLSFSAGFGTAVFGEAVRKCRLYMEEHRKKHVKSLLFSLSIQVSLMPAQVEFFNIFCPYSPLLNCLLLPFVPIVIIFGFTAGFLADFSYAAGYAAAFPAKLVLLIYNAVISLIMKLPYSVIVTGHMTGFKWIAAVSVILFFCMVYGRTGKATAFFTLLPAVLLIVPFHSVELKVSQLYVGQGDCCIITQGNTAVAVDCGSSDEKELYRYCIKPYLYYNGYAELDCVFLSHADEDHVSGIREYLADNPDCVTKILIPELKDSSAFDTVLSGESISSDGNRGHVFTELACMAKVKAGDIEFICLYPDAENRERSENDTSMVLYMRYGGFDMLFMGDLSKSREESVLKHMEEAGLDGGAAVLKAGHHGSKNSTGEALLEHTKPEFALISCGVDNIYNHPSEETLDMLSDFGINTLITAESGQITIRTNGVRTYSVSTFFN